MFRESLDVEAQYLTACPSGPALGVKHRGSKHDRKQTAGGDLPTKTATPSALLSFIANFELGLRVFLAGCPVSRRTGVDSAPPALPARGVTGQQHTGPQIRGEGPRALFGKIKLPFGDIEVLVRRRVPDRPECHLGARLPARPDI